MFFRLLKTIKENFTIETLKVKQINDEKLEKTNGNSMRKKQKGKKEFKERQKQIKY